MEAPTFEEFTEFIRQTTGTSRKKIIFPSTQFENDLGVTGDDGVELWEAVEKHFGIPLTNESFGLGPDENLFESEGFGLINFARLFRPYTVRRFTVGELYAVLQAQCKD